VGRKAVGVWKAVKALEPYAGLPIPTPGEMAGEERKALRRLWPSLGEAAFYHALVKGYSEGLKAFGVFAEEQGLEGLLAQAEGPLYRALLYALPYRIARGERRWAEVLEREGERHAFLAWKGRLGLRDGPFFAFLPLWIAGTRLVSNAGDALLWGLGLWWAISADRAGREWLDWAVFRLARAVGSRWLEELEGGAGGRG